MKTLLTFSVGLLLCSGIAAADTGRLTAKITGLTVAQGKVALMIYDAQGNEYQEHWLFVEENEVTLTLDDMPLGKYAIKLFHDANNNGTMDTNFLGIPTESFGFSNNPKLGVGEPDLDKLLFDVTSDTSIEIQTRTLF